MGDADPDSRGASHEELAGSAAQGDRKPDQPRSVLCFGGIFFALFRLVLGTLFWRAAHGRPA